MTHTLHRLGKPDDLEDDFPWLITPRAGVNDKDLAEKIDKVIDIIEQLNIEIWGYGACKNTLMTPLSEMRKSLRELALKKPSLARLRGVCTSREQLKEFLKALKEVDLGISVTVSGLIDEIFSICREIGLKPHSVNLSLGVWGKKELLPLGEVLEVTTMCGHSLISPNLVNRMIEGVKEGRIHPREAAILLAKTCPCGVFNIKRAERLLRRLASK